MIELIALCAPNVAPETITQIIKHESSGNPLAINVGGLPFKQQPKPKTIEEAATIAKNYIQKGHIVDMGLMQVSSSNLKWLNIPLTDIEVLFAPCPNITAGGALLSEAYQRAVKKHGRGQRALQAALSAYNTGNFTYGFKNGYVAKYYPQPSLKEPKKIQNHSSTTNVTWTPPEGYFSE